ncbi:MAG: hypothetical protein ACI4AM_01955 [Muribaculaceae bacterium]
MLLFLGRIIQLLLSPEHGWEDISAAGERAEDIQRRRYLPLVCVVALSQLVRLFYEPQLGVFSALAAVVAVGGAYLASLFIAKMVMAYTIRLWVDEAADVERIHVVVLYTLGITAFYRLIYNLIPTPMMLLKLLPLLSLLVILRATDFLGVSPDKGLRLIGLGFLAVIVLPYWITCLFMMFI